MVIKIGDLLRKVSKDTAFIIVIDINVANTGLVEIKCVDEDFCSDVTNRICNINPDVLSEFVDLDWFSESELEFVRNLIPLEDEAVPALSI